jgi:N-acetylmuramoyl-L-alanine amidase
MTNNRFCKLKLFFLVYLFCFFIPNSLLAFTLDETLNTLSSISPNSKIQFRWDPLFQSGVFYFGNHYGSFSVAAKDGQTGFLLFNNRELFNVPLPYNNNGRLVFPEAFVASLKNTFTRLHENDTSRFRISTIVIDPGHGGRDSGTIGYVTTNGRTTQVFEKDIVLKVALTLRDLLKQTYPDKQILMTRDTDIYRTLDQRSDMANAVPVMENEAVIFISIHVNWGANPNARGYEVWHITSNHRRSLLNPASHDYSADIATILNAMLEEEVITESILLADSILQGLGDVFGNTLPSRGPKANDWFVVRNSRMPAVLVELGFVSNRQDLAIMNSEEGLQKFAHSLYNGITNFIGIFER